MITAKMKPGKDAELQRLVDELKATEQPGSGLLRSSVLRDQNDPLTVRFVVVFESEAQARARENDERRNEGLQKARAIMADIFDGPPEFTDRTVFSEYTP